MPEDATQEWEKFLVTLRLAYRQVFKCLVYDKVTCNCIPSIYQMLLLFCPISNRFQLHFVVT